MNVVKVGKTFYLKVDAGTITGVSASFTYTILDVVSGVETVGAATFSEPISGFYTAPISLATVGEYVITIQNGSVFYGRLTVSVQSFAEDIDSVNSSIQTMATDIAFIKAIEGGRWKIINNQMVFYTSDNTTEVARFNLTDAAGTPTETNVMERTRV